MTTPLPHFPPDDPYGRSSIPGMKGLTGERRMRKIAHGRKEYFHRVKNGVYDPITYFHALDALLEAKPNEIFRTAEFVAYLNATRPQLIWDSTTVGRVLNDLAETLYEKNRRPYLSTARRWNGMVYAVAADIEARTALINLLEDLMVLCGEQVEAESRGESPKRLNSPLQRCASLAA